MRQYKRRILLFRDGHVETDVVHFHDVSRAGVQLDRRVWNVLFDADQRYAVSAAAPSTKSDEDFRCVNWSRWPYGVAGTFFKV